MSEGAIVIDRLPLSIVAAASADRAERVTRQMRDGLARGLPAALQAACGRTFDDDERHVFIDRLDVHCAVASHWDDAAIARAFAQRLARALLSSAPDPGTMVFRDRPEYLAAFLVAAADGTASSRWWFEEFAGLFALPASAAIRTATIADPAAGILSLARLTREALARVLAVLTQGDARRILAAVVAAGADGPTATLAEILAAEASAPSIVDTDSARVALATVVALERTRRGTGNGRAVTAIDWLADMRRGVRAGLFAPWLEGAAGDAAALAARAAAAGIVMPPRDLSDNDAVCVVEHLRRVNGTSAGDGARAPSESDADAVVLHTPYGGALLLGALIARLGWWAEWPSWLALAVAARALGGPRAAHAMAADEALRRAFGVERSGREAVRRRSPARSRRAIARVVPAAATARDHSVDGALRIAARVLLREFARRLPGCERASARYLRRQCLAGQAVVTIAPARVDARLGRAPLDVLLRLSGLHRAEVTLPDGRVWSLVAEDQP